MIEVVRRLQFCAGHRVVGHEGKCKQPHGHNYVVFLHARSLGAKELDELGRVIDFGVLKEQVGVWIETNWDHCFIVWGQDTELLNALHTIGARVFPLPNNPTAENIANYLLRTVCPTMLGAVQVYRVELMETENCIAVATLED